MNIDPAESPHLGHLGESDEVGSCMPAQPWQRVLRHAEVEIGEDDSIKLDQRPSEQVHSTAHVVLACLHRPVARPVVSDCLTPNLTHDGARVHAADVAHFPADVTQRGDGGVAEAVHDGHCADLRLQARERASQPQRPDDLLGRRVAVVIVPAVADEDDEGEP